MTLIETRVTRFRIGVQHQGRGEPLVLLHGWPTTWMTWEPLFPGFVAAGCQMVTLDTPGLGDSAPPAQGYARLARAQAKRPASVSS